MSVNNENNASSSAGQTTVLDRPETGTVYASLFDKINLTPVTSLGDLNDFQDTAALADVTADQRVTAAVQVFLQRLKESGQTVERLDKTLLDSHIATLDHQISRQLDVVMHNEAFQQIESAWRGLKHLVDRTDFRQNVKIEVLDVSKDDLRQDFEDCPEIIQSGLYYHTYIQEYDTPGGEPIGSVISNYEFDASAQDVALLRNISKVSAAAHMPFVGSVGPKFFLKDSMEEVAAIKDIGNAEVLRGTLALYDWTENEMNRRRLDAIAEVKHSEIERFERGYLLRGVHIEITLDSNGFAGTGDICLFGEMLSHFFALYTDIHLFNRLTLILQPTGERLEWEENHKTRLPG